MGKNFFRFVSGFLGLVFLSLVFVLVAGFYDDTMSKRMDGGYTVSPGRNGPASIIFSEKKDLQKDLDNVNPIHKNILPPEYPPELE
jgi:hypothetical protein